MSCVEPCAFLPCPYPAEPTLRVLVDGCVSVVTTCQRHADWLSGYVREDAAVVIVEEIADDPSQPAAEKAATNLA